MASGPDGSSSQKEHGSLSLGSQEYFGVLQGWPERALAFTCGAGTYQLEQQEIWASGWDASRKAVCTQ